MAAKKKIAPKKTVAPRGSANIVGVRGERVLLDRDVAELFEVDARTLNQQVTRNKNRFVDDFAFRLTWEEFKELRSQNVILQGWNKVTYPPVAFTEHGIVMAAAVLNSDKAIQATRHVIKTFVEVRREAWEREVKRSGQIPLSLDIPTRQGLSTKLNMALGQILDQIVDPEEGTTVKDEAGAIVIEATKSIKAYLKKAGIENDKTLAEVHRIIAEAENIKVDAARKRTETKHRQLGLMAKKLKLLIQAQHYAETGSVEGLMAVLSDLEKP